MDYKVTLESTVHKFAAKVEVEKPSAPAGFGSYSEVGVGKDGATFYPHVDDESYLSWTNDQDKENPKAVNIRGRPGKDAEVIPLTNMELEELLK